jgi:hypothetical protein
MHVETVVKLSLRLTGCQTGYGRRIGSAHPVFYRLDYDIGSGSVTSRFQMKGIISGILLKADRGPDKA